MLNHGATIAIEIKRTPKEKIVILFFKSVIYFSKIILKGGKEINFIEVDK